MGDFRRAAELRYLAAEQLKLRTAGRRRFRAAWHGDRSTMRIGNTEVRFLGGGMGCLLMIALSVVASILLTVLLNVLL
jgi:hypothetical protein